MNKASSSIVSDSLPPLIIIKIGGKLVEDDEVLNRLCDKIAGDDSNMILVHGGGNMAGQLSAKLGITVKMHDGRRITDRETLDVTVMAYAGLANKRVVAAMQARGVNACGLSGCDMGVIVSHKRDVQEIDWGYVGDIDEVKGDCLAGLLEQKIMPVLSPVTCDLSGHLLNTNADSVASAVAQAMCRQYETELIYCLDKPGVLTDIEDDDSVIPSIDREQYLEFINKGLIHSGMIPKLENAFITIATGVKTVRLTSPEQLRGGTIIHG